MVNRKSPTFRFVCERVSQNRYQLRSEKNWTHEIEVKCDRSVQDGVQTVKSHGIQNGYYFVYGTRIVSVLLRRTQLWLITFHAIIFLNNKLQCFQGFLRAKNKSTKRFGTKFGWKFYRVSCIYWFKNPWNIRLTTIQNPFCYFGINILCAVSVSPV